VPAVKEWCACKVSGGRFGGAMRGARLSTDCVAQGLLGETFFARSVVASE
jgi:hypothetical protein